MPQDSSGLSRLSTAGIAQANRLLDLRTPLARTAWWPRPCRPPNN